MRGTRNTIAAAGLALLPLVAAAIPAEAQRMGRTIVVEGSGMATAAPDMATVTAGVETAAETAADALRANGEAMRRVFERLEAAGIDRRDIATTSFDVDPRYADRRSAGDQAPRIVGYRVSNDVVVRVRQLDSLGTLLDALVSAGANRIGSIAFGLADPDELEDEARRAAVADATRKARLYAEAAGVDLGPLLRIDDTSWRGGPVPRPDMRALAAEAVPIAEGERAVTAGVRMVWRIVGLAGEEELGEGDGNGSTGEE